MKDSPGKTEEVIRQLQGKLIVSCQADDGEPLASPEHIKALSLSAINGGAGGLRLEGTDNIKALRAVVQLPIIGLIKSRAVKAEERLNKPYITASFAEAKSLAQAGCDIIALDATQRPRADGLDLACTIERIHDELGKAVWADVSTLAEGIKAQQCGADLVSTTLYGYTEETKLPPDADPDLNLVRQLAQKLTVPVVLEGRVWYPEQVAKAIKYGAYAVVVGSAITRPQLITQRFVKALG